MIDLNEVQDRIKKFNDDREWSAEGSIKDLLLNMTEEIGELWTIIKWVDVETQMKLIRENKEEVDNFIGDMLYLVLKVSYLSGVDPEKAIGDVLEEYERRFPIEKSKGTHGNVLAGGIDDKD